MDHKTRAAIGRTIEKLSDSCLQKVFVAYGKLFLRVTHAISRRQEFIADEVAANAAGASVMASALRKAHGYAGAFHGYWSAEVSPVLNSGYLPPLAAGFAKFVQVESVRSKVEASIRAEESEGQSDPFDTHLPLRERVAALQSLAPGSIGDTRPAVALLGDPLRWERRLLGAAVNEDWAGSLTPVVWDNVVDTVYAPIWRAQVQGNARLLAGVTSPARLPFAGRLTLIAVHLDSAESQTWIRCTWAPWRYRWPCSTQDGRGTTSPREEIVFRRGGHEVRVFGDLMQVATGTGEEWAARCAAWGLGSVALGGA